MRQNRKLGIAKIFSVFGQQGMGLLEAIMISVVVGIIVYGLAGIMTYYYREKARVEINETYEKLVDQIKSHLNGTLSWANTLNGNNTMNCLQTGATCWPQQAGANIKVYDGANNVYFDSTVATNGFNYNGEQCNTYDDAAGNDDCPFSFDVIWLPDAITCMGGGDCSYPEVRLRIRPKYRPANWRSTTVNILKNRDDLRGVDLDTDYFDTFTNLIYDKIRVTSGLAEPFVILENVANGAINQNCTPVETWIPRNVNLVEESDPNNNVSVAGSVMTLLKVGSYTCNVTTAAFQVGLFKNRLYNTTNTEPVGRVNNTTQVEGVFGIGFANPVGLQDIAQFEVNFTVTRVPTNIRVEIFCNFSNGSQYEMGLPNPSAAGPTYTLPTSLGRVMCVRNN